MSATQLLLWVLNNLLTEEQLDAEAPTGLTLRYYARVFRKD